MENNDTDQPGFGFLNDPQVQRHFADLNIELLKGKHIIPSQAAIFTIADKHEQDIVYYYHNIYGLKFEKRTHDNMTYFYLVFPTTGKGRLSGSNLYEEFDSKYILVACILANLYFSNYFSYDKKFQWDEIRYEIEHAEHREAYQQLFFNEIRPEYTEKEWENVKKQFGAVINFFHRINLVEKEDSDENIHFTILPTIHHFIDMYKNEIENIDIFLKELKS